MPSVDNRVVRMEFDNKAFDSKVKATLVTLNQLDKALKLEGAHKGLVGVSDAAKKVNFGNITKGLNEVNASAQKVDINSISRGIESVSKGFIAMSTVAVTALATITSGAISAGAQIAKSLSLDQVIAGFSDYELKIGATQTIMAGTGENIGTVTKHLKELDVYADKTIYNLRDMVGNISKFTNAGVKLPVATKAMIGIANSAALSGASSEEASRAMYNLGQAIGQGTVRMRDWISVDLANMGTLEFKQQLIDSAVAMGTLKKESNGTLKTLQGTEVNAKNFSSTLGDMWLTSEALVKTLERYGDETTDIGKRSWAAAQDVKTFSMMAETLRASISTGWTDTFDIIIGDLGESKKLFTGLTNTIGGFFGNMADRRNELLRGWKAFGGRDVLIKGLKDAFHNLLTIMNPIRLAFRTIFPATTVKQLLEMTQRFANFAKSLKPTGATVTNLYRIFKGFFAALSIGWTIIKEGTKFIRGLALSLIGLGGPGFLEFAAKIGDVFTNLQAILVKGGGIADFFKSLAIAFAAPIPFIKTLITNIAGLFGIMDVNVPEKLSVATGRVGDRFESLGGIFAKLRDIWRPIGNALSKTLEIIGKIANAVKDFFVGLGKAIADVMGKGSFDQVLDLINVGLLGAIVVLLRKFFKKGIKFDIGEGFLSKIGKMFEQLTGVLKALQAQIKAQALLKIAIAMGILTASVVALSLIDSAALTKALTAMAVGFGQLMGTFALINKMDLDVKNVATFTIMAVAMVILTGAMLLLAAAAKTLATLDWNELAKGLTGVGVLLGMLVGVIKALKDDLPVFIATSLAMIGFAIAINILAGAVKIFASMSWEEMIQGLVGVGVAIGGIVLAIKNMQSIDLQRAGIGLLLIGVALFLIGTAVKRFSDIGVSALGKGFIGIAAGLYVMAKAMDAFPNDMPIIGLGLVAVGIGLILIAKSIKLLNELSIFELVKGIAAIAVILKVLSVTMNSMTGATAGAGAVALMAGSLLLFSFVIKQFAAIKLGDLAKGILSIIAVMAALAATAAAISATGAIAAMLALGAALLLIGGGFALFGAGAYFAAKALKVFSTIGKEGAKSAVEALAVISTALPKIIAELTQGFIDSFIMLGEQAPKIAAVIVKLLSAVLDAASKLIPKFGKVISLLIQEGAKVIRSYIGEYIKTGIFLILSLLEGIRQAIPRIVIIVGEIIVGFLDAMAIEVPRIIEALLAMWVSILSAMAEGVGRIMATLGPTLATSFFTGFLEGLNSQFGGLLDWFMKLPGKILDLLKGLFGIKSPSLEFMNIGIDLILGLLQGLINTIGQVFTFFTELPGKILNLLVTADKWLVDTGIKIIKGIAAGFLQGWHFVTDFITGLPETLKTFVNNMAVKPVKWLVDMGKDILQGIADGVKDGGAFLKEAWNAAIEWLPDFIEDRLKIDSPSRVMAWYGKQIVVGLATGINNSRNTVNSAMLDLTDSMILDTTSINSTFQKIVDQLDDMKEFNPVITPVLDLTKVAADATKIAGYISTTPLTPAFSLNQARIISADTNAQKSIIATDPATTPGQVKFEQNIYAPEQLSTADIYRQTRNQISMAKEELKIP